MTTDPLLSLLRIPPWTIRPSRQQPSESEIERTHVRRMPLPYALDFWYQGKTFSCRYAGHGQSKVVYGLYDDISFFGHAVLKLTKEIDKEPYLCKVLQDCCSVAQPAIKLCPEIHDMACCIELNSEGRHAGYWFAWVAEHAIPLNKFMSSLDPVHRQTCLKIALYKQVVAAQCGLLLSDNNLFNLGVVSNTVVIIDCGSRDLEARAIPKGRMNQAAMHKWWKKLSWQCGDEHDFTECREIWQHAGNTLDEVAEHMRNMRLYLPAVEAALSSVEQPAAAIIQAPAVWEMLEQNIDDEAMEWLKKKCYTGKLASLKLLQNGHVILLEHDQQQAPHIRVETLIRITQQKRRAWINSPDDILSADDAQRILATWKADHNSWMKQSSQQQWLTLAQGERHEFERRRFKAFLFRMCGSCHLVKFWLRVKPSWRSLHTFYEIVECHSSYSKEHRLDMAVQRIKELNTDF